MASQEKTFHIPGGHAKVQFGDKFAEGFLSGALGAWREKFTLHSSRVH